MFCFTAGEQATQRSDRRSREAQRFARLGTEGHDVQVATRGEFFCCYRVVVTPNSNPIPT